MPFEILFIPAIASLLYGFVRGRRLTKKYRDMHQG